MMCYSLSHSDDQESHGCCDSCGQWLSDVLADEPMFARMAVASMIPQNENPPF